MPVVVVTAALLLVALASHVVPPRYGRDAKTHYVPLTSTNRRRFVPPPHGRAASQAHHYSLAVPSLILLGVIAAGLAWGLTVLLGRRYRLRPSGRHTGVAGPDRHAAARLEGRIQTAVEEGLDDLGQGAVTDAIIACWLRLEQAAASAGAAPARSDTPTETVVRVLGQQRARPGPLEALAELYREARFSRHAMDATARAAARAALEDIRADLARDVAATAAPGTPGA